MKNKTDVIGEIISVLFTFLFVYAAVSKLLDYEKFKAQIGQSPMLTDYADWIAWIVPAAELIISLMFSFYRLRLAALYASFALMVTFTTYIIVVTNFSTHVPCSCGGILENLGWTEHLVFNIVFVLLAATGIYLHARKIKYGQTIAFSQNL
jgi:uncharacterized membrane protein YphA (DoxX/SURF4 family)